MSIWWLLPLALGALAAVAALLGATRLRREGSAVRDASEAIRALTVTVAAAPGATGAAPAALRSGPARGGPGPALPRGPTPPLPPPRPR